VLSIGHFDFTTNIVSALFRCNRNC
jgi:hypothetical protein